MLRVSSSQQFFHLFLFKKTCISHQVAHLSKIIECQAADSICIRFAHLFKRGEYFFPVVAMRRHQFLQHRAIFKTGIHSLAEKWHDAVRCIADQAGAVPVAPRVATKCRPAMKQDYE